MTVAGAGKQFRKFLYVTDIAAAHVLAMVDEAAGRTYNLEGDRPVTVLEVAEIIQVMSPRPDLLEPFLELYLRVMRGPSELSRAEREWVAVLTSDFNDCHY
jgi:nucleoside-diphosphate-sugar epimerase